MASASMSRKNASGNERTATDEMLYEGDSDSVYSTDTWASESHARDMPPEYPSGSVLASVPSASVSRSALRAETRTSTNDTARIPLPESILSSLTSASTSASVSRSALRPGKSSPSDDTPRPSVSRSAFASTSSASVSRSALRGEAKPTVNGNSGTSATRDASTTPASVSKSALRGEKKSLADGTLRGSLAAARGIPAGSSSTVMTRPPPVYSSRISERPKASSTVASRAPIVDSVILLKARLKEDIDLANSTAGTRKTAGFFRDAASTDLLFLIDTTSSMTSYIEAAKNQVRAIVGEIRDTFLREALVRVAVVSYKDHGSSTNVEKLDFTSNLDTVRRFLDTLHASGGADIPEDVLGGIQQAINMSWSQQTRCIIHIADAPPHGSSNHDLGEAADHYYTEGSEPHGLTYEPLFRKLTQLKINYALLRINYLTDRMTSNFADVYGHHNAKLLPANAFYDRVNATKASSGGWSARKPVQEAMPQFEEQELGTTYDKLRHLVVKIVTASFSRTAGRLSVSLSREAPAARPAFSSGLSVVREAEDPYASSRTRGSGRSIVPPSLETGPPRWDTPGWLDETLEVEGFCPAIVVHHASTLGDMMYSDDNIKLTTIELTIYARSKPFAEGSVRLAAYARIAASSSKFVIKSFKSAGHNRAHVAEDMRMQALCKAFALEFNGLLKIEPPLDFIVTSCLQKKRSGTSPGGDRGCLSLEPYIDGDYIKYNNNAGWVCEELADDPFCQIANAFSHFTFERSWGRFMVNDLQGVGRTLTDPSVQTHDPERFKLNDTNLGDEGFKLFFSTHECNTYCKQLELESNRDMFISKEFKYRERWPTMDPTVCCSNKLCRRIIRLASAQSDERFPGHHWCDSCWTELQGSMVTWMCEEPGEAHEFEVSRFYHVSQGEVAPKKCMAHREKKEATAAVVGGSLYSKMKATESRGSIRGDMW